MTVRAALCWLAVAALAVLQFAALAVPAAALLSPVATPARINAILAGTTLLPALAAAVVSAVGAGTLAAVALWRLRLWGLAAGLLLAPLLVPTVSLAGPDTPIALALLLARHASLGLAFGAGCGLVRLIDVDLGVLRAAACCGVSPAGTLRRVVLPIMAPGILAACLLSAAASVLLSITLRLPALDPSVLHAMAGAAWLPAVGAAAVICAVAGAALALLRGP